MTTPRWRPERRTLLVLAAAVGALMLTPSGTPTVDAHDTPATTRAAAPMRPAVASVYGPGLWGNHVWCSQRPPYGTFRLRRTTWGVAHRTLPCGTRVTICDRRCVTVPVIDRGPFAVDRHGRYTRDFDLTLRPALVACQCSSWQSFGVRAVRYRIERGR